jgi:hypothetical protein
MTERTITSWVYLVLSFLTLYIISLELVPIFIVGTDLTDSWHPTVATTSNQYHLWRIDRLTSYILPLLNNATAIISRKPASASFIQACIFYIGSLGITLSLRPMRGIPKPNVLLLSSVPVLLTIFTVGWDDVVLGTLAWIPLLALLAGTLLIAQRQGKCVAAAPVWAMGAFVSFQHAASANHLALLSAIAALGLAYALTTRDLAEEISAINSEVTTGTRTEELARRLPLVPVLTLLPALVMTFYLAPPAPFPDYPATAHLVPDDGIEGTIQPLIGRDYPIPVIDRARVKASYKSQAVLLSTLALVTWLLTRKLVRRRATYVAQAAVIALSISLLDTVLPEQYAAISPIMSLARLLPWGTTFCLTSIVLAAGAWLLGILLVTNPQRQIGSSILAISIALTGFREIQQSPLRKEERLFLLHPHLIASAISPSAAVLLREYHATGATPKDLLESARASNAQLQSLETLQPHIESSVQGSARALKRMIDKNVATKWSTAGKPQDGSEYISIAFPSSTKIRALEIDPGKYTSDFPRGLSIYSNTCSSDGEQLASYPSWQGALSVTPQGLPFYKGQHKVIVAFATSKELNGLCIRQTSSSAFEWAVAELRYLPDS